MPAARHLGSVLTVEMAMFRVEPQVTHTAPPQTRTRARNTSGASVSRFRCIDGVHDTGRWELVSLSKPVGTPAKGPRQRRTRRRRALSPVALRRPTLSSCTQWGEVLKTRAQKCRLCCLYVTSGHSLYYTIYSSNHLPPVTSGGARRSGIAQFPQRLLGGSGSFYHHTAAGGHIIRGCLRCSY